MKSLDQTRAARAYATITDASKDAMGWARNLPAMLQQNGLLATWAFLLAQKKRDSAPILDALRQHFGDSAELAPLAQGETAEAVFLRWVGPPDAAVGLNGSDLRRLSAEALALSGWLKRAVEARGDAAEPEGSEDG